MNSRGVVSLKQRSPSYHAERKIKNIGPKGMQWLKSIGIESHEDLERMGSVEAYRKLKETIPGVNILMLYAMEAALWDLHWNDLPPEIKSSLHDQVGYVPPIRKRRKEKHF
jgi:DNA transformation protein